MKDKGATPYFLAVAFPELAFLKLKDYWLGLLLALKADV